MLKESGLVRKASKWSEVKKNLDTDPRYKQVESSSQKEEWFKDYQKGLPVENSVNYLLLQLIVYSDSN